MTVLYIMVGIPGSGKSTYASKLALEKDAVIVSTDAIRKDVFSDESSQADNNLVFKLAYQQIENYIETDKDVIFDATNLTRKDRKKLFTYNKCSKIAIVMCTELEECKKRNSLRERKVPEEVIDRMWNKLQFPDLFEGFDEVRMIGDYNAQ